LLGHRIVTPREPACLLLPLGLPLLPLVVLQGACVAEPSLFPDIAELLHPETLMMGVVPGEVAVRLEPLLGAPAVEKKFLVITHD